MWVSLLRMVPTFTALSRGLTNTIYPVARLKRPVLTSGQGLASDTGLKLLNGALNGLIEVNQRFIQMTLARGRKPFAQFEILPADTQNHGLWQAGVQFTAE